MLGLSPQPRTPTRRNIPAYELDLIAAAQRGDISAFNQLVRAHQDLAYRLAFHLLDDASRAELVTQRTFESAYSRIRHLSGEEFRIWVLRIVVSECSHAFRRSPNGRAQGTLTATFLPIEMGLAALNWNERVICVLADVLSLQDEDIVRITKGSLGSIRATRGRARRQIRDVLKITGAAVPGMSGIGRG
jgi:DNA-directed RNA polymerase specialized sigma24 family protein